MQVVGNGLSGTNGLLSVTSGGLTVAAGGLSILTGNVLVKGDSTIAVGTMNVIKNTAGATLADFYASSVSYTGNVFSARVPLGATTGNALSATVVTGANTVFSVRRCVLSHVFLGLHAMPNVLLCRLRALVWLPLPTASLSARVACQQEV